MKKDLNKLPRRQLEDSLKTSFKQTGDFAERMVRPEAVEEVCVRAKETLAVTTRRERINFSAFLRWQIRFICGKIWLMQAGLLVLLCTLLEIPFREFPIEEVRVASRYLAFFLCCLSAAVLFSAVPFLYRSSRYVMYELELTTRFSSVKLLFARLFAIGIGNLLLLAALLGFTLMRTALGAESVLLYLLLPYLAAGGGLLYLLGHFPAEKLQMGSVGLGCILFTVLILLRRFWPAFFVQRFSFGWGMVCLALFVFCIVQVRYLMCRSMYAKVQIL